MASPPLLFRLFQLGTLGILPLQHLYSRSTTLEPPDLKPSSAPLLTLPLEILHKIIDFTVESPEPTLALLRRTHRSFYNLIPAKDVRSRPSYDALANQLAAAECCFCYVFPPEHHACLYCLRVRPVSSFPDYIDDFRGTHRLACLHCGILDGKYGPNREVTLDGIVYRDCTHCRKFHAGRCGAPRRLHPWPILIYSAIVLLILKSIHHRGQINSAS